MSRPTEEEKQEILESIHKFWPEFEYINLTNFDDQVPGAIVQAVLIALDITEQRRVAAQKVEVV